MKTSEQILIELARGERSRSVLAGTAYNDKGPLGELYDIITKRSQRETGYKATDGKGRQVHQVDDPPEVAKIKQDAQAAAKAGTPMSEREVNEGIGQARKAAAGATRRTQNRAIIRWDADHNVSGKHDSLHKGIAQIEGAGEKLAQALETGHNGSKTAGRKARAAASKSAQEFLGTYKAAITTPKKKKDMPIFTHVVDDGPPKLITYKEEIERRIGHNTSAKSRQDAARATRTALGQTKERKLPAGVTVTDRNPNHQIESIYNYKWAEQMADTTRQRAVTATARDTRARYGIVRGIRRNVMAANPELGFKEATKQSKYLLPEVIEKLPSAAQEVLPGRIEISRQSRKGKMMEILRKRIVDHSRNAGKGAKELPHNAKDYSKDADTILRQISAESNATVTGKTPKPSSFDIPKILGVDDKTYGFWKQRLGKYGDEAGYAKSMGGTIRRQAEKDPAVIKTAIARIAPTRNTKGSMRALPKAAAKEGWNIAKGLMKTPITRNVLIGAGALGTVGAGYIVKKRIDNKRRQEMLEDKKFSSSAILIELAGKKKFTKTIDNLADIPSPEPSTTRTPLDELMDKEDSELEYKRLAKEVQADQARKANTPTPKKGRQKAEESIQKMTAAPRVGGSEKEPTPEMLAQDKRGPRKPRARRITKNQVQREVVEVAVRDLGDQLRAAESTRDMFQKAHGIHSQRFIEQNNIIHNLKTSLASERSKAAETLSGVMSDASEEVATAKRLASQKGVDFGKKIGQIKSANRVTAAVIGGSALAAGLGLGYVASRKTDLKPIKKKELQEKRFSAEDGKKKHNPYVVAAASGAATGGILGGATYFIRGTKLKSALKAAGTGALLSGGLVGAGSLVGSALLGKPKEEETAGFTKRAALGGAIVGATGGATLGIVARRSKTAGKFLGTLAEKYKLKPLDWMTKAGAIKAGLVGGITGGAIGSFLGADEGQQVDSIRNISKEQNNILPPRKRTIQFNQPEATRGGAVAKHRYINQIDDTEWSRNTRNYLRSIAGGALLGAAIPSKRAGILVRAGVGALVGGSAQGAAHIIGNQNRDMFGDKSVAVKKLETAPWVMAGLGTLGAVGLRGYRMHGKAKPTALSAQGRIIKLDAINNGREWMGKAIYSQAVSDADFKRRNADYRRSVRQSNQVRRGYDRSTGLIKDVGLKLRGEKKIDSRGRERVNEWDKSWVRNAAYTTAIAGGLFLTHRGVSGIKNTAKMIREQGTGGEAYPVARLWNAARSMVIKEPNMVSKHHTSQKRRFEQMTAGPVGAIFKNPNLGRPVRRLVKKARDAWDEAKGIVSVKAESAAKKLENMNPLEAKRENLAQRTIIDHPASPENVDKFPEFHGAKGATEPKVGVPSSVREVHDDIYANSELDTLRKKNSDRAATRAAEAKAKQSAAAVAENTPSTQPKKRKPRKTKSKPPTELSSRSRIIKFEEETEIIPVSPHLRRRRSTKEELNKKSLSEERAQYMQDKKIWAAGGVGTAGAGLFAWDRLSPRRREIRKLSGMNEEQIMNARNAREVVEEANKARFAEETARRLAAKSKRPVIGAAAAIVRKVAAR